LLSVPGLIGYVYMIKKKTLKERIKEAKKKNCLTLLDLYDTILLTLTKGQTHYE
tara:strand:+ start:296 stop:457 length:162 start_codon:yes stop_codon:yes gene_type:complete